MACMLNGYKLGEIIKGPNPNTTPLLRPWYDKNVRRLLVNNLSRAFFVPPPRYITLIKRIIKVTIRVRVRVRISIRVL